MELQKSLAELYDWGRVAYLRDPETTTRTWFDIPRILGMAVDTGLQHSGERQDELASMEGQAAELLTRLRAMQGKP